MLLTNKYQADEAIVAAVANDSYDYKDAGDASITALSVPAQIRVLRKRYWDRLTEDVSDRLASLRGQVAHGIVERSGQKNFWSEKRIGMMVNGWKITGRPDKVEAVLLRGHNLTDFKFPSLKSFRYSFQRDKGMKPEYLPQGNGYRRLLWEQKVEIEEIKFKPTILEWSPKDAVTVKDYPDRPFFNFDIPIWSMQETDAWILDRVKYHQASESLPDAKLPPCTDDDMWGSGEAWAVKKEGKKNAVRHGVKETQAEAEAMVADLGEDHYVEHRPSVKVRCEWYCSAKPFCQQYKKSLPEGVDASMQTV
jgi:hypothetical protein